MGQLPEAIFIPEFLETTLFAPGILSRVRGHDDRHYLARYRKDFRIKGHDIWTHEEYEGINMGEGMSTGITLFTFGGSSVSFDEITTSATQVHGSNSTPISITRREEYERLKMLEARFSRPLAIVGNQQKWDSF